MARAGTAFIAIRGDFTDINKQVSAYGKTLDRSLNRGTNAWQAATKKQTQTLQQLGRTARFAAGGVGLLGGVAIVKSIGKAADFEQQMSNLGAVTRASARDMDTFKRQAIAAGAATKFSALDAAKAQVELAKGGLNVKQIMGGGLKAALSLAAAGELDLADAADTTVNAIKLFGLRGNDAVKVADALATAANKTTADVSDFALALKQGGSVAKIAGLDLNETVTVLEALAEAGIKGSDAGTSMKSFFLNITNNSPKAKKAMDELGVSIFDQQGNLKSLPAVSENLRHAFGSLTKEQFLNKAGVIAGSDAVRTLYALYDAGPDKLRKLEKANNKQGTAADVAAKKQDNFRGKLENFQGSVETLQISVGTQLLPVLTNTAERLTTWANRVAKISGRKDLDVGEKIRLSLKLLEKEFGPDIKRLDIPGKLAAAISFAVPRMAEAAAKAAPKVVRGFFDAFRQSNIWGKLVIGGFLLHKLGGIAAFRALGAKSGGGFAQGFASTAASGAGAGAAGRGAAAGAGAVGGAAAGRAGRARFGPEFRSGAPVSQLGPREVGRFRSSAQKIGPQFRAIGKATIGVSLMLGVADAVTAEDVNLRQRFQTFLSTASLGLVPPVKPLQERLQTAIEGALTKGSVKFAGFGHLIDDLGKDLNPAGKRLVNKLGDIRRSAAKVFGAGAKLRLEVAADPKKAERGLANFSRNFKGLKNQWFSTLGEMRHAADQQFATIEQTIGTHTKRGQRAVQRNFSAALGNVRALMDGSLKATRKSLPQIARLMSVYSGRGTADVGKNLKLFQGRLSSTFVKAGHITSDGMLAIRLAMTNQLEGLGLSQGDIKRAIRDKGSHQKPTPAGGRRTRARGSLVQFGRAGDAGRDTIPVDFGAEKIMVGSGEVGAVFNRHQLPILNARLSDMGGLPGLFKQHNKKHYEGRASGGLVGAAKGFARGGLVNIKNIVALGRELQREGYAVGENPAFGGVHPVHVKGSYHYSGQAIDVNADNFPGGEAAALDKLDARLKRLPGVIELLWRVAGHFDHLHVAMAKGGKGGQLPGGGGVVPQIPGMTVEGKGALAAGVQRALDVGRAGAQMVLDRAAPAGDIGEGAFKSVSGKGGNRALGKRMAEVFAGWGHGPEWGALDDLWGRLEGSWNENLANLAGSGAYGIAQALPSSKYPPAGQPDAPPGVRKAKAQIAWGLNYIRGRYGDPLAAHAARLAQGWYGEGGLIEAAGGVAFGGGARGPSPKHPGATRDPDKKKGDKKKKGDRDRVTNPGPPGTRDLRYSVPGKNPYTVRGGKGVGGTPAEALRKTLERARKSKDLKKTLAPFLKRMEKFGLPKRQLAGAKRLLDDHVRFAAFAENADKLSTEDADGNTIMGVLNGQSVLGWDVKDLGAQFKLRNRLIDIRETMVKRRAQVARALKIAEVRLKKLSPKKGKDDKGKVPRTYKHTSPMDAGWNKLTPGSRRKFRTQFEHRGGRLASGLEWAKNNTVHKVKADSGDDRQRRILRKVVPALTKQKKGLNDGLHDSTNGVLVRLADLQGPGPKGHLKSPWPIGTVFGGSILDTQLAIKQLTTKTPTTTDTAGDTSEADSRRADLLAQLLREANLRTAVAERGFDVLKNFPPYGGQFATGGVVPGPAGAPRTIIAHGGETVTPPNVNVGDPEVHMHFHGKAKELEGLIDTRIEYRTRKQANAGSRGLPGRAGSLR